MIKKYNYKSLLELIMVHISMKRELSGAERVSLVDLLIVSSSCCAALGFILVK